MMSDDHDHRVTPGDRGSPAGDAGCVIPHVKTGSFLSFYHVRSRGDHTVLLTIQDPGEQITTPRGHIGLGCCNGHPPLRGPPVMLTGGRSQLRLECIVFKPGAEVC